MPRRRRVWTGVSVAVLGAAMMVFGPTAAAWSATSVAETTCAEAQSIAESGGDDALRVAVEVLEAQGVSDSEISQCLGATEDPSPATEVNLGELWTAFTKKTDLLVPIAAFVGVSALVLLALGRLLALVPGLRNPRSMRFWRRFAWAAGLVLAVGAPALIALRGMWVMAQGGPAGEPVKGLDFGDFIAAIVWRSGFWWLLLALVVVTVATLTFAFATRQGVTVKMESKGDGTGLDTVHVMAAMDGMAGSTNRGLEFPVGTDVTTAAAAVTELSDNRFVATLQVAVSAILGSTPWRVTIENEHAKAASVTISRNGALIKAKRVKIGEILDGVTEASSAELLAALISGEIIAGLRSRYRSEFDADLSGATDGESIALHYVASSALAVSAASRAKAVPVLARAVELDPNNRAAWTTLANFVYRDPKIHRRNNPRPHLAYRDFLDRAILDELQRARNNWDRLHAATSGTTSKSELKRAEAAVRLRRMKRNGLLARLLQTRIVAAVNARAADPSSYDGASDADYQSLRRRTFGGPLARREPPKTAIRRRQLLLVDEFREVPRDDIEPPSTLAGWAFRKERRAWEAATRRASGEGLAKRVAGEDAALRVSGNFDHDPMVAYAVACYRADRLLRTTEGGPA